MDGLDAATTNSSSVTLGSRQNQLYFAGNMDDVAIFNAELSGSDVTNIYNSGTPKDESSRSNLVGYWKMGDGDTHPTLIDSSSNSNNGTMTNMSSDDIEANTSNGTSGTMTNMDSADFVAAKDGGVMTNMASDDIVENTP